MNTEFLRGDSNILIQSQSLVANPTGSMSGDSLVHELGEIPRRAELINRAKISSFGLEYQKRDDMWRLVGGLNSYLGRGPFGFIDGIRVLPSFLPSCIGDSR